MADEPETIETPAVPVVEPGEGAPAAAEPTPVHPLEPGGERFEQVYARMRTAEADRDAYRRQLETRPAPATPPAAPQTYTPQQLQTMVDAAQITPAQMAAQLVIQGKAEAKAEMRQEWQTQQRSGRANDEVREYLKRAPALMNPSSAEFAKVSSAAWEIADELGLEVQDPRVQRRALREVMGALDKVPTVSTRAPAPYAETQSGGGSSTQRPAESIFKGIPEWQLAYWRTQGYSQKDMEAEAKVFHDRAARGVGSIRMRKGI